MTKLPTETHITAAATIIGIIREVLAHAVAHQPCTTTCAALAGIIGRTGLPARPTIIAVGREVKAPRSTAILRVALARPRQARRQRIRARRAVVDNAIAVVVLPVADL